MTQTVMLFAYGSNMDESRLVARGVKPLSKRPALLEHYSLAFNKKARKKQDGVRFGYANIVPSWMEQVEGVRYEMLWDDLTVLDKFEGFPTHYQKTIVTVSCPATAPYEMQRFDAVTYIATPVWMARADLPITEEYGKYMRNGYEMLSEKYATALEEKIAKALIHTI